MGKIQAQTDATGGRRRELCEWKRNQPALPPGGHPTYVRLRRAKRRGAELTARQRAKKHGSAVPAATDKQHEIAGQLFGIHEAVFQAEDAFQVLIGEGICGVEIVDYSVV